jgi:hypothetical protein
MCTQITLALILAFNYIFYIFYKILDTLWSSQFELCSKEYNRIDILHWIVAPQIRDGLQHNYSTKTRQVDHANEQPMYSLMSTELTHISRNIG